MEGHILYLFGILALTAFIEASDMKAKNLALYGRATQSDRLDHPNANPNNAIDGNRDSDYFHGSCTHTDTQTNPWWRVDLLDEYTITSIIITNRGDCCPERLNDAEIHIGNSLVNNGNDNEVAVTISSIPLGKSVTYNIGGKLSGRYINVNIPAGSRILTLCEVEVYGYPTLKATNVALNGIASQSSLYGNSFAFNAIDGNTDGKFDRGSCSCTSQSSTPWWRLDLLQPHKVFSITVYNRQDAFPQRLNGAEIRIGDSLVNNGNNNPRCAVITMTEASNSFTCNGMVGRYINIVIPNRTEFLTLCEVEVFGVPQI